jgi:hypothetical protein
MTFIALIRLLFLMPCLPTSRGVDNTKCRSMRELRMHTNSRSLHALLGKQVVSGAPYLDSVAYSKCTTVVTLLNLILWRISICATDACKIHA